MVKIIFTLVLSLFITSSIIAQDRKIGKFKTHKEFIVENSGPFGLNEGNYFIIVSAPWCAPCQRLKEELKSRILSKGYDVVVVDFDEDEVFRIELLQGTDNTIPKLLKYSIDKTGKAKRLFWKTGALEDFFKNE